MKNRMLGSIQCWVFFPVAFLTWAHFSLQVIRINICWGSILNSSFCEMAYKGLLYLCYPHFADRSVAAFWANDPLSFTFRIKCQTLSCMYVLLCCCQNFHYYVEQTLQESIVWLADSAALFLFVYSFLFLLFLFSSPLFFLHFLLFCLGLFSRNSILPAVSCNRQLWQLCFLLFYFS